MDKLIERFDALRNGGNASIDVIKKLIDEDDDRYEIVLGGDYYYDRDVNAAINIKEIAFDKQNLVGV